MLGLRGLWVLDGCCAVGCGLGVCYFDCLGFVVCMVSFCVAVLICVVWVFVWIVVVSLGFWWGRAALPDWLGWWVAEFGCLVGGGFDLRVVGTVNSVVAFLFFNCGFVLYILGLLVGLL